MLFRSRLFWDGVLQKESQWAYADQGSFKMRLRDVYKKYRIYENRAKDLQEHIRSKFTEEKMYKQFIDIVSEGLSITTDLEVDEMYAELFG